MQRQHTKASKVSKALTKTTKTTKSSPTKQIKRSIKTQKKRVVPTPASHTLQQSPSVISANSVVTKRAFSTVTLATPQHNKSSFAPKSNLFRTKRAFSSTTEPAAPAPEQKQPLPLHQRLDLKHILVDLEFESLIPAIENPPQLQSLLLDQSKFPAEQNADGSLQVYHLILLSSQDFRAVFSNDLQRNRLKEHIRNFLGGPLLVSDGAEPMSRDQYNKLLDEFYEKQHLVPEPTNPTPDASVTPPPASDNTPTTPSDPTPAPTSSTQTTSTPQSTTPTATTEPQSSQTPIGQAQAAAEEVVDKQLAKEMLKISLEPLRMPQFFDKMKTGSIQTWHVKVGEHFVRGQLLCDIDTDIAELSFEAPEPGHLSEILVQQGESVPVGEAIAVLRYQEDTLVGTKH